MRAFVVIVDGCDKTGKTTLAARLGDELGWPVVKCNQPGPGGAVAEYLDKIEANSGHVIFDRFHLGESVYGPIYRDTAPINASDHETIERALMARGAFLVLMEDAPRLILERFQRLGETFARPGDIGCILSGFEREFQRSRLQKVRVRWSPGLPGAVVDLLGHMGAR